MATDRLNSAIALAKSGDKVAARQMLSEIVKQDPINEAAWLWLSTCVDTADQKRFCLNRALAINPSNQNARKALAQLEAPPQPSLNELSGSNQANATIPKPISSPKVIPTKPDSPQLTSSKSLAERQTAQAQSAITPNKQTPSVQVQSDGMLEKAGGYVKSTLLPNEKVIAIAKLHWGIFIAPGFLGVLSFLVTAVFMLPALAVSSSSRDSQASIGVTVTICILPLWIVVGLGLLRAVLTYITTEFALTDRRVIGKTGFIRRQSLELVLNKVESVRINQSIMGRLLNFGTIVVSGSGGTHQGFPNIADPMKLKQKINSMLSTG